MKYAILLSLLALASCKKGEGWDQRHCWHCESATVTVDSCIYVPPTIKDSNGNILTCKLQ